MGVDDVSDSISISKQTVEKCLVMPSEVTSIPTLGFFIQLTDYPVSKDKLDIVNFPKRFLSYIGREDLLFKPKATPPSQNSQAGPALVPTPGQAKTEEVPQQKEIQKKEEPGFSETKGSLAKLEAQRKEFGDLGQASPQVAKPQESKSEETDPSTNQIPESVPETSNQDQSDPAASNQHSWLGR